MLVATLGAQWAQRGKRVVLVDMNTGMRCLDMLFGLESRIAFDLGDVAAGICGLDRALVEDKRTGVRLIAARQFGEGEAFNERSLQIILEVLAMQNDYVILDTPSGSGYGYQLAVRIATESLLVTTPDDISMRDAERLVTAQREMGRPAPSLVVSRVRADLVEDGLQYTPKVCGQVLDIPVLGVIEEDPRVVRRMLAREPMLTGHAAALAVTNLLERMEDGTIPLRVWWQPEKKAAPTPAPAPRAPEKRGLFSRRKRWDG